MRVSALQEASETSTIYPDLTTTTPAFLMRTSKIIMATHQGSKILHSINNNSLQL
jgi:hypothetical protein